MKSICAVSIAIFCLTFFSPSISAPNPTAGFFLPDSIHEMTLKYRTVNELIVLPVTINDSISVNLILDTGCRNLILFGKKFRRSIVSRKGRGVQFSGLGDGKPVTGSLSIGNKVSINEVLGEQIPIVVVDANNLFANYHNVHGVIGYDIFLKFEIEINHKSRTISFRPALKRSAPYGFATIPLRIVDARPIMDSHLILRKHARSFELMIDTGSSLGLLLKTTNIAEFDYYQDERVLGIGLNGPLSGFKTTSKKLILDGLELDRVPTGIVSSTWHNNASIGMEVLKDYVVILNYCKAYAGFRLNA